VALSKELNDKVISLTGRLPQIWGDETISDAHRKALLRCLIEKLVLDRGEYDFASAGSSSRGGAVTELELRMSINSVIRLMRGAEMGRRLLTLAREAFPTTRSPQSLPAATTLPIAPMRCWLGRAAAIKVTVQRARWDHDGSLRSPPALA